MTNEVAIEILEMLKIRPRRGSSIITAQTAVNVALQTGINALYQKKGKWVPYGYDGYFDGYPVIDVWECSECGYEHNGEIDTLTAYCPDCGRRMEIHTAGSDET
ncbi:MAG: hypothetical protein IKE94_07930 [Aeriscardovia sp.]|nr:hypothetical protein [Aeriscardovia sp.]